MGLLNCHPDVLCLYEVDLPASIPNSYATRLLRSFPQWRDCFGGPAEPASHYERLAERLHSEGHRYTCLLDKLPTLSPSCLSQNKTSRVIYAVRDVRTWLGKASIDQMYVCGHNLVPAAVDYALGFVNSFRLGPRRCLHVNVEEFLQVKSEVPPCIFDFLEVPYFSELDHWWQLIESQQQDDPIKATFNWLKFHPSSTRPPGSSDTSVSLAQHKFWDDFLPIFDHFRSRCNEEIASDTIEDAVRQLLELRRDCRVSRNEAFREISTTSFGAASPRSWGKRLKAVSQLWTGRKSPARRAA